MKFKKLLALGVVAFAAHSQMAHAQWSNFDVSKLDNLNMEMPIESEQKPFSYDSVNSKAKMEMPLASDSKSFSYDEMPMASKEDVSGKMSSILEKMRNDTNKNQSQIKYK